MKPLLPLFSGKSSSNNEVLAKTYITCCSFQGEFSSPSDPSHPFSIEAYYDSLNDVAYVYVSHPYLEPYVIVSPSPTSNFEAEVLQGIHEILTLIITSPKDIYTHSIGDRVFNLFPDPDRSYKPNRQFQLSLTNSYDLSEEEEAALAS